MKKSFSSIQILLLALTLSFAGVQAGDQTADAPQPTRMQKIVRSVKASKNTIAKAIGGAACVGTFAALAKKAYDWRVARNAAAEEAARLAAMTPALRVLDAVRQNPVISGGVATLTALAAVVGLFYARRPQAGDDGALAAAPLMIGWYPNNQRPFDDARPASVSVQNGLLRSYFYNQVRDYLARPATVARRAIVAPRLAIEASRPVAPAASNSVTFADPLVAARPAATACPPIPTRRSSLNAGLNRGVEVGAWAPAPAEASGSGVPAGDASSDSGPVDDFAPLSGFPGGFGGYDTVGGGTLDGVTSWFSDLINGDWVYAS